MSKSFVVTGCSLLEALIFASRKRKNRWGFKPQIIENVNNLVVIFWVNWCKNECFWQRTTCKLLGLKLFWTFVCHCVFRKTRRARTIVNLPHSLGHLHDLYGTNLNRSNSVQITVSVFTTESLRLFKWHLFDISLYWISSIILIEKECIFEQTCQESVVTICFVIYITDVKTLASEGS